MFTINTVFWLCVLDSNWPRQVMAWQALRDMWRLGLVLLLLRKFAVSHLLCADDSFPWKAWCLAWVFDSLMTWKLMSLPDSQWVIVYNTKHHPYIFLAFFLLGIGTIMCSLSHGNWWGTDGHSNPKGKSQIPLASCRIKFSKIWLIGHFVKPTYKTIFIECFVCVSSCNKHLHAFSPWILTTSPWRKYSNCCQLIIMKWRVGK